MGLGNLEAENNGNWLEMESKISSIREYLVKEEEITTLGGLKDYLNSRMVHDKDLGIQLSLIKVRLSNYIKTHGEDGNFMSFLRNDLNEKEISALLGIIHNKAKHGANLLLALAAFEEKEDDFKGGVKGFFTALHGSPEVLKGRLKNAAKKETDKLKEAVNDEKNTRKQILYINAIEIFTNVFIESDDYKKTSFEWLKQNEVKDLTYGQVSAEVAKGREGIYQRIFKKPGSPNQDTQLHIALQALVNKKDFIGKIVGNATKLDDIKLEDIMISIGTKGRTYGDFLRKLKNMENKGVEATLNKLKLVGEIRVTDKGLDLSSIRSEDEKPPKFLSISDIDPVTAKGLVTSSIVDLSNPEQTQLLYGLINQKGKTVEKDKQYLDNVIAFKNDKNNGLVKMLSDLVGNKTPEFFDFFSGKDSPLDIATTIRFYEKVDGNTDTTKMNPFLQAELFMMLFSSMKMSQKRGKLVTSYMSEKIKELIPSEAKNVIGYAMEQAGIMTWEKLKGMVGEGYELVSKDYGVLASVGLLTVISTGTALALRAKIRTVLLAFGAAVVGGGFVASKVNKNT